MQLIRMVAAVCYTAYHYLIQCAFDPIAVQENVWYRIPLFELVVTADFSHIRSLNVRFVTSVLQSADIIDNIVV